MSIKHSKTLVKYGVAVYSDLIKEFWQVLEYLKVATRAFALTTFAYVCHKVRIACTALEW